MDNVLIAFEFIHHMKSKTWSHKGDVALKIDINKAYDTVDWKYLKLCLLRLGFAAMPIEIRFLQFNGETK